MTHSDDRRSRYEVDFSEQLRQRLETQSSPLTPQVQQGLRRARAEALAQRKASPHLAAFWKPVAGLATAAVLALATVHVKDLAGPQGFLDADMDAELLFSGESFQFYEDLEFYHWLANNDL